MTTSNTAQKSCKRPGRPQAGHQSLPESQSNNTDTWETKVKVQMFLHLPPPPLCVSHFNRGLVWCRESEVTLTVAQHQNILHQHPAVRSHCGLDWSSFIVYSLLHFTLVSVLLSFSILVLCGFGYMQELSVPVKPGEPREGSSIG